MKLNWKVVGAAAAAAAVAGSAAAGSPVYGYGNTRAGAAADAEANAKQESYARFKKYSCYTPVRPQDCKEDSGGWVCIAYVANHAGSCGSY